MMTGKRGVRLIHRDISHNYDRGDHISNTYAEKAVQGTPSLSHCTIEVVRRVGKM